MSKHSKKTLSLNNDNNSLKNSQKILSNWQCFQKHIIPSLEGPRQQRNIEASKIWQTKSLNQKNKYDCSSDHNKKMSHKNISSPIIKLNKLNDKLNELVDSLLNEIEKAQNYKLEIPDLNYRTTTVNIEMLKNIIFKYEQIKNQFIQKKNDKFNLLKKQMTEIKTWLNEQEEYNQSSYEDLQDELKSINQTSATIKTLEEKIINNTSPKLRSSSLLEEAKNNSIILKQIENLLDLTKNFNKLKTRKLDYFIEQCNKLVSKIYDNYETSIGKTEIFVRLDSRLQEMNRLKLEKKNYSLKDYKLISTNIKII